MAVVMVERSFATAEEFDVMLVGSNPCLTLYNVRFVRSYGSPDRKRMICVYDAPDAESVRLANRQGGKPFDRVWTADVRNAAEK